MRTVLWFLALLCACPPVDGEKDEPADADADADSDADTDADSDADSDADTDVDTDADSDDTDSEDSDTHTDSDGDSGSTESGADSDSGASVETDSVMDSDSDSDADSDSDSDSDSDGPGPDTSDTDVEQPQETGDTSETEVGPQDTGDTSNLPPNVVDSEPPTWPPGATLTVSTDGGTTVLSWPAANDSNGVEVYEVWVDGELAFTVPGTETSVAGAPIGTDASVTIEARDAAGNSSNGGPWLPSVTSYPVDPAEVAPALPETGSPRFLDTVAFLVSGNPPLQAGVEVEQLAEHRAAVVRGRVLDADGLPREGVLVRVLDHEELGRTWTRTDGMFDLLVNGGGVLNIVFEREGSPRVQRGVDVPWEDTVCVDDVVMLDLDAFETEITLTGVEPTQVAEASVQIDDDGARQARLVVPEGTLAAAVLPDGSEVVLDTLTLRMTEYTVGESGPAAMPGPLPPTSAYTYAVDVRVDEAAELGAETVSFTNPVYFYLENFLGFPVGEAVPTGWFDHERGVWVPSDSGIVLEIVSVTLGLADVDLDDDGVAEDSDTLETFGFSDAEREKLAERYLAGDTLWRVPLPHLTPLDMNWPIWTDAQTIPPLTVTRLSDPRRGHQPSKHCTDCPGGGTVELDNAVLRESLPIADTVFSLHYGTDRTPAMVSAANAFSIPLGVDGLDTVTRIDVELEVAGRLLRQSYDPSPGQTVTLTWDGLDAYGRAVFGTRIATVRLGYSYSADYTPGERFGSVSREGREARLYISRSGRELSVTSEQKMPMGGYVAKEAELGGWTLSHHHRYDRNNQTVYFGDGTWRRLESGYIETVVGDGTGCYDADTCLAEGTAPGFPVGGVRDLAVGPDGSVYALISTGYNRSGLVRVYPDQHVRQIAGGFSATQVENDIPAAEGRLGQCDHMALGPDLSVYVSCWDMGRILRITPDERYELFAGNGGYQSSGDGGPASAAGILYPDDVVADRAGAVYFWDKAGAVRRVGTDGIIDTFAGTLGVQCLDGWSASCDGYGIPAASASIAPVEIMAFHPNGDLYMTFGGTVHRIVRVDTAGVLWEVYARASVPDPNDLEGTPFATGVLSMVTGMEIAPDGSIYASDPDFNYNWWGSVPYGTRIRRISPSGILTTVGGQSLSGYLGDGVPAVDTPLGYPMGLDIGPDGWLYVAEASNSRVRRIDVRGMSGERVRIPSESGDVVYEFDGQGRHVRTLDGLYGTELLSFSLDGSGRLVGVGTPEGTVAIVRDGAGTPLSFVSARGLETELEIGAGWLTGVTDPWGDHVGFTYDGGGLLTSITDRHGRTETVTYTTDAHVASIAKPDGSSLTLTQETTDSGRRVSMMDAAGRVVSTEVEELSTNNVLQRHVGADGAVTVTRRGHDGDPTRKLPTGTRVENADGTITDSVMTSDARLGRDASHLTELYMRRPSGAETHLLYTQTAALDDPQDPFSWSTMTLTADQDGRVVTQLIDRTAGTRTLVTPTGREFVTTVDSEGRPVLTEAPGQHPTRYGYDDLGRLNELAVGPDDDLRAVTWTFDEAGRVASRTGPTGAASSFTYDERGRLLTREDGGQTVTYEYDADGLGMRMTLPDGEEYAVTYDLDDPTWIYDLPDVAGATGIDSMERTDFGGIERVTWSAGGALDYAYDPLHRLSEITDEFGTRAFSYDTAGRLEAVEDASGVTMTFSYDGPVVTGTTWEDIGSVTLTYDASLRIVGDEVEGDSVSYAYNDEGELVSADDLTVARDPDTGFVTATSIGVVADEWEFDGFGEVTAYRAKVDGATVLEQELETDALGRVVSMTERVDEDGTTVTRVFDYTYDDVGQIESVDLDGSAWEAFEYDTRGNRLSGTLDGVTTEATYDARARVTTHGDRAFTYGIRDDVAVIDSPSGDLLIELDGVGAMRGATLLDGTVVAYELDGHNREVLRKLDGVHERTTLYASGLRPSFVETDSAVQRFVYGTRWFVPDVLRDLDTGAEYRVISDYRGDVRFVIDTSTGEIVQRKRYSVFGVVLEDTNPGFQPFGFVGGVEDSGTGLLRIGAREYDPSLGRFLAPDAERFFVRNPYLYAGNDPVSHVDPSGQGATYIWAAKNDPAFFKNGQQLDRPASNLNTIAAHGTKDDGGRLSLPTDAANAQAHSPAGIPLKLMDFDDIVRALESEGSRFDRKQPIFLSSCWVGASTLPQRLADHFGVPVYASTLPVYAVDFEGTQVSGRPEAYGYEELEGKDLQQVDRPRRGVFLKFSPGDATPDPAGNVYKVVNGQGQFSWHRR